MREEGRGAFTLIEVLISIALLGLLLTGLYSMLDRERDSNKKLYEYLQNSAKRDKITTVLYNDILKSDGNMTIARDEYDRLCIESTRNSLYALGEAKVCWIVAKEGNRLIRIEGNGYELPLKSDSRVSADIVMDSVKTFRVENSKKGTIVVALQKEGVEPYTFAVYGIRPPIYPKKKRKKRKIIKKPNKRQGSKKSDSREEPISKKREID